MDVGAGRSPILAMSSLAASGFDRSLVKVRQITAGPASEVELEFWRSIKDTNKPEELNAYLTNYPNGTFKSLALARIASLQDGPSTTTRNLSASVDPSTFTDEADRIAEDQIGLDRFRPHDGRAVPQVKFSFRIWLNIQRRCACQVIRRCPLPQSYRATADVRTKNRPDGFLERLLSRRNVE